MIYTNYFAVLAAAVAAMVLGYLWYGPLFGKQWKALTGWRTDSRGTVSPQTGTGGKGTSVRNYAFMFFALLLMSFTLSHLISLLALYAGFTGIVAGVEAACMGWFGFIVPSSIGVVLWERQPWRLWLFNAGYYLAILLIMGIILGAWR